MDRCLSPWPAFSSPKHVATLWHARGESNAASCLNNANGGETVRKMVRPCAAAASGLAGGLHQALQFAVHELVAHEDIAFFEHLVAAVDVGGETAGFADQRDS